MNVYLGLGNSRGSGFWNEGYRSQGREMGGLVYEQPEDKVDGSCQGGFQVSKRGRMGKKENRRKHKARGDNKARGKSVVYI